MKRIKHLLAFILAFIIIIPSVLPAFAVAEENPTEQGDLTKRTGLKPFEIEYISADELPKDDTYERKVVGSSAYGTGKNSEWAEYSTYFYYNQMTADERSFYDKLMNECLIYLTDGGDISDSWGRYYLPEIPYGNLSESRAMEIYRLFYYSNPQFYFLMNGFGYNSEEILPRAYDAFYSEQSRKNTTAQIKSALSAYEAAAASVNSEYEKVKMIHDMLCSSVTYNNSAASGQQLEQDSFSQSIYSVLILQDTVCMGYASVFEMICNKSGIDAITEVSEGHAWNRVAVDDIWYVIDCTWDDEDNNSPGKDYEYFLRSYNSITQVLDPNPGSSHVTRPFMTSYMPSCTMDCVPSYDNSEPGEVPIITYTALAPELTESNGSFMLSAESGARIYYTVDGTIPAEGQRKSNIYQTAASAQSGTVVKAYAVVDPKKNSEVKSWVLESGEDPMQIKSISIIPSALELWIGGYTLLTVEPGQAFAYVQWSSSDVSVATVDNGMVKAISKGTAVITAKVGNASADAVVTVVDPNEEVDVTIKAGRKTKLKLPWKVAQVEVLDKSILKIIKKKGRPFTVKGKKRGIVWIQGYTKGGTPIGWIVVKVE